MEVSIPSKLLYVKNTEIKKNYHKTLMLNIS